MNVDNRISADQGKDTTNRKVVGGIRALALATSLAVTALLGGGRTPVAASVEAASTTCPDIVTRQYVDFNSDKRSFNNLTGVKFTNRVTDDCTGNVLSTRTRPFPIPAVK